MREFVWGPQEIVLDCMTRFKKDHVHINITTPNYRHRIPQCGDALYLKFVDFGENCHEFYKTQLMTDKQAEQIVEYIRTRPTETLIVVNCEAGISRSAGVVLACRRHYGGDTEEIFKKAFPNIYVSSKVFKALGGFSPEAEAEWKRKREESINKAKDFFVL